MTLDAYGVGGPQLQAAGLRAVVDTRELMTMGFLEVLLKLPKIFRILKRVVRAAKLDRPDVAIVIDYPGFHFRLARGLRKLGVPLVYYIPPKIWAWRQHRVRFLRKFFDRILCIFPFEEAVYRDLGVAVKYVGNPLMDELPLGLSRADARRALGLADEDVVLVVMPGSRESELNHHLECMLSAVALAAASGLSALIGVSTQLKVLVPFPETADLASAQRRVASWRERVGEALAGRLDLRISRGDSAVCLVAADAGLIKSGTSTLEAALLNCPHVVVYRPNRTGIWVYRKLVRYKGFVGLVNLIVGKIVPEVLCEDVIPSILSQHVVALLTNQGMRAQMFAGFESLRAVIRSGGRSPSASAAAEIFGVLGVLDLTRGGRGAQLAPSGEAPHGEKEPI